MRRKNRQHAWTICEFVKPANYYFDYRALRASLLLTGAFYYKYGKMVGSWSMELKMFPHTC